MKKPSASTAKPMANLVEMWKSPPSPRPSLLYSQASPGLRMKIQIGLSACTCPAGTWYPKRSRSTLRSEKSVSDVDICW